MKCCSGILEDMLYCKPLPKTNITITTTIVEAAAMEESELAEFYTYNPTLDTSDFTIGNETFLIASELRHQVNIVASALASTLDIDAPPATLCVPAYCQTAEKRSAANLGGPGAPPFEVHSTVATESRALQTSDGVAVKAFVTAPVSEIAGVDIDKPVEALLFVSSSQDFAGAGSKSNMKVSGAQVICPLFFPTFPDCFHHAFSGRADIFQSCARRSGVARAGIEGADSTDRACG